MNGVTKRGKGAAMFRKTTVLPAMLLLGGCISFGLKPPEEMISLTASRTAASGAAASGSGQDAILVLDPDTSRRLDVMRVPVQINDYSIAYLKDAMWVEKPARQFRRVLAESIRAKGGRMVVEADDADAAGRTVLGGRLLDMGYDAPSQSVIVRFDAVRHEADGTISTHRFETVIPGVPAKARPVAHALNDAANDVAGKVADWMN